MIESPEHEHKIKQGTPDAWEGTTQDGTTRRTLIVNLSKLFGGAVLGGAVLEGCTRDSVAIPSAELISLPEAPPGFPTVDVLAEVLKQGEFFMPPSETPTHRFADYWNALDQQRGNMQWPLHPLTEIPEAPIKQLDLVVHPLYYLFVHGFQPELWQICRQQKGIEAYVPMYFLGLARGIANDIAIDPDKIPQGYFLLRDLIEELDFLNQPPAMDTAPRVLVLPRRSQLPHDGRTEAYESLVQVWGQSDRVFGTESYGYNSGILKPEDLEFLRAHLDPQAHVGLQGGYLHLCLSNTLLHLVRDVRDNGHPHLSLMINVRASTTGTLDPTASFTELKDARLIPPKGELKRLADIRAWIMLNQAVNEGYDAVILERERRIRDLVAHFALMNVEYR